MNWSFGTEWNRFVDNANAIFFTNCENIEQPVVCGQWNIQIIKLFFVFINIYSEPSPVAITIIIIDITIEPR